MTGHRDEQNARGGFDVDATLAEAIEMGWMEPAGATARASPGRVRRLSRPRTAH